MWSNIVGFLIEDNLIKGTKSVSNGSIEIYYKNIKINVFKGSKHKLGRIIRKMERLKKYRTDMIKMTYKDHLGKHISPGT